MEYLFSLKIEEILKKHFDDVGVQILDKSQLLQYIYVKNEISQ